MECEAKNRRLTVRRKPELDGLRALAVLSVLIAHTAENAAGPVAVVVGDIGSRGVDLFFILSGCCLAYPLLCARAEGVNALPSPAKFLRRRIARIAPPYYVSLLVFGVLAFTTFGLPAWPFAVPDTGTVLRQLLLDAAFLTNIYPLHNPDYWTLGIEMRWYLFFPFAIALYVRSRAFFAIAILTSAILYRFTHTTDFGMLPCFMLGIVAADIAVREALWRSVVWPSSMLLLCVAIWLDERSPGVVDHTEAIWQFVAFLIVVGVMGNRRVARLFSFRVLERIGIASYSIYLVHHPIVDALARAGVALWIAGLVAIVAGFAYWRFVEMPLLRREVRGRIERALRLSFLFPRRGRTPEEANVGGTA
jgi:exopolysaccharide production protein ExoZ